MDILYDKTTDYDYHLPPELIAQTPLPQRDASRLLCLERATGALQHRTFGELTDLLNPGDLLVLNDSRVLPARLLGTKIPSGGAIQFLLLERRGPDVWEILVKPGRKARPGARFSFGGGQLTAEILDVLEGGNRLARFAYEGEFYVLLERIGQMPLPEYIHQTLDDRERYQTVYARQVGSAAAPTAGLHFTPELLEALGARGISTAKVTLHVGLGTFRPVKAERIADHHMHSEHYAISAEAAAKIAQTRKAGGRVIAVGTTSCRTLEAAAQATGGEIAPGEGNTNIFIYPGYQFGAVDGLITNFHLPQSTLIMLVSAFAGHGHTMAAYRAAVEERYRFYSFGDAMLII